jgi:hypothetical protein
MFRQNPACVGDPDAREAARADQAVDGGRRDREEAGDLADGEEW